MGMQWKGREENQAPSLISAFSDQASLGVASLSQLWGEEAWNINKVRNFDYYMETELKLLRLSFRHKWYWTFLNKPKSNQKNLRILSRARTNEVVLWSHPIGCAFQVLFTYVRMGFSKAKTNKEITTCNNLDKNKMPTECRIVCCLDNHHSKWEYICPYFAL